MTAQIIKVDFKTKKIIPNKEESKAVFYTYRDALSGELFVYSSEDKGSEAHLPIDLTVLFKDKEVEAKAYFTMESLKELGDVAKNYYDSLEV